MYGILAVFGPMSSSWLVDDASAAIGRGRSRTSSYTEKDDGVLVVRSVPRESPADTGSVYFEGEKLKLILDGYLLVDNRTGTGQEKHLQQFGRIYLDSGLEAALACVRAGAFRLAILDVKRGFYGLVNDAFGSVPLFVANIGRSVVLSTNPMAVRDAPGISAEADLTGIASWTVFGYPVGNRFLHKAIRAVPAGTLVDWNPATSRCSFKTIGLDTEAVDLDPVAPRPEVVASLLRNAVQRIADFDQRCAHLQSGGMDSRAILAAWPNDNLPTCYTYGVAESAEVMVAKAVAEVKGAKLHYWPSSGDQVADALEDMYQGNGLFVYPDRYLIGKKIAADGHRSVADGYLGGVLLGGSYFANVRHFPAWSSVPRLLARLSDLRLSSVGDDELSNALFTEISELKNVASFDSILAPDFLECLQDQRSQMLDDIHGEVVRLRHINDSLSHLFRDFLITNRAGHAIAQQATMCRQHVDVRFPFTNDFDFLRVVLRLRPQRIAYHRYYMKLFRDCFQEFASIPYAATMLPLTRPPIFHRWSALLSTRGIAIPGVTGSRVSRVRPVNWNVWLHDSAMMRNTVLQSLKSAGIANSKLCDDSLKVAMSSGKVPGGKLMHVAAAARWI